jgi:hypothetical protein
MTNPPNIDAIIAELSEAQRRRLTNAPANAREMSGFGVIYDASGNYRDPPLVERAGLNHPIFGAHYRFTPLGLAVRSALIGEVGRDG